MRYDQTLLLRLRLLRLLLLLLLLPGSHLSIPFISTQLLTRLYILQPQPHLHDGSNIGFYETVYLEVPFHIQVAAPDSTGLLVRGLLGLIRSQLVTCWWVLLLGYSINILYIN